MGNARLLLYLSLAFVSLLLWERWNDWNRPADVRTPTAKEATMPMDDNQFERRDRTQRTDTPLDDMPAAGTAEAPNATMQDTSEQTYLTDVGDKGGSVAVETDLFSIKLSLQGGDIRRLDLSQIPIKINEPQKPFRLLDDNENVYWAQTGLLHDRLPDIPDAKMLAPSHHALYTSARARYEMSNGDDILRVPLRWQNDSGIEVEKTYIFRRGSYLVEIEHRVRNNSAQAWVGRQYGQLRRVPPSENGSPLLYTFTGAAYYDGKYNKIDFSEIEEEPLSQSIIGGWVAMLQHYFVSALIPAEDSDNDYYTKAVRGMGQTEYLIGLRSPALAVAAGTSGRFSMHFYSGPKIQNKLEQVTKGLELTTDYGIFTVISKPLFWLLDKIHSFIGNWGGAIILLTMLIKLVFYKLSEASYRSMAKMRKFQPQLLALRERHKDDRSRLSQEMMQLYRQEKVNPLGGCLPILVQIPVFIALYWVLLESVELRQAPFILWIHDLSVRDPYFVLPLLMGATMLIQNKLNPTPPDPIQAKVMMILPIVFTFFFAFFPSGLVLYWFVNNVLSISQQWVITRRVLEKKT